MARGLVIKLTPDQVAAVFTALPVKSPLRAKLMAAVKLNNAPHPRLMDLTQSGMVSAYDYEQLTDINVTGLAGAMIPKEVPK